MGSSSSGVGPSTQGWSGVQGSSGIGTGLQSAIQGLQSQLKSLQGQPTQGGYWTPGSQYGGQNLLGQAVGGTQGTSPTDQTNQWSNGLYGILSGLSSPYGMMGGTPYPAGMAGAPYPSYGGGYPTTWQQPNLGYSSSYSPIPGYNYNQSLTSSGYGSSGPFGSFTGGNWSDPTSWYYGSPFPSSFQAGTSGTQFGSGPWNTQTNAQYIGQPYVPTDPTRTVYHV